MGLMMIPFVAANLGVRAQKFRRHPNTRISLTRSFMLPSTLVSVRLTHGIIWIRLLSRCSCNSLCIVSFVFFYVCNCCCAQFWDH